MISRCLMNPVICMGTFIIWSITHVYPCVLWLFCVSVGNLVSSFSRCSSKSCIRPRNLIFAIANLLFPAANFIHSFFKFSDTLFSFIDTIVELLNQVLVCLFNYLDHIYYLGEMTFRLFRNISSSCHDSVNMLPIIMTFYQLMHQLLLVLFLIYKKLLLLFCTKFQYFL